MDEHGLGWLALAWFDGFGAKTLHKLWDLFGPDGARAWDEARARLNDLGCHTSTIERFAAYRTRIRPERLQEELARHDMRFVRHDDAGFPYLLGQIADPPFGLFVRGQLGTEPAHPIAVVGTRRMGTYGKRATDIVVSGLAEGGATIVSGLALGVDAAAHHTALEHGGTCLAVLGSGCDEAAAYPRTNLGLLRDILAAGGAVISEHPPGTPGLKHHFPLRNRLIAGISRVTVVIEAAEGSGSLITAFLALGYDREVFAVPGPIDDIRSSGTNKLLSLGAKVCRSAADVLSHAPAATDQATTADAFDGISVDERRVLTSLHDGLHPDDIARTLGLSIREVISHVSALELRGAATRSG